MLANNTPTLHRRHCSGEWASSASLALAPLAAGSPVLAPDPLSCAILSASASSAFRETSQADTLEAYRRLNTALREETAAAREAEAAAQTRAGLLIEELTAANQGSAALQADVTAAQGTIANLEAELKTIRTAASTHAAADAAREARGFLVNGATRDWCATRERSLVMTTVAETSKPLFAVETTGGVVRLWGG